MERSGNTDGKSEGARVVLIIGKTYDIERTVIHFPFFKACNKSHRCLRQIRRHTIHKCEAHVPFSVDRGCPHGALT